MANRTGDLNLDWISCARKVPYRTRKVAKDAATRLGRKDSRIYRPYPCGVCGAFHLTSQPR